MNQSSDFFHVKYVIKYVSRTYLAIFFPFWHPTESIDTHTTYQTSPPSQRCAQRSIRYNPCYSHESINILRLCFLLFTGCCWTMRCFPVGSKVRLASKMWGLQRQLHDAYFRAGCSKNNSHGTRTATTPCRIPILLWSIESCICASWETIEVGSTGTIVVVALSTRNAKEGRKSIGILFFCHRPCPTCSYDGHGWQGQRSRIGHFTKCHESTKL